MCPLWPFHYLLVYLILFASVLYIAVASPAVNCKYWSVTFDPSLLSAAEIDRVTKVNFNLTLVDCGSAIGVRPVCSPILSCWPSTIRIPSDSEQSEMGNTRFFSSSFNVSPTFMGYADVKVDLLLDASAKDENNNNNNSSYYDETTTTTLESIGRMPITAVRKSRLIDHIFTASVAILVSIIFVNFGCALDLNVVKENFTRPLGPLIGMVCQFLFMPLIGFAIGKLVFPDSVPLQLGLFFTGVSPSGGASNIWICMLGGNLNLSITITSISNLFAFFTIPLWTFTLGRVIFDKGAMVVPYRQIAIYAVSLLPPLIIGLVLQSRCPKFSQLMVRILKPFSSCLILFIIIFASVTNFYLFKLFTWQILLAGLCLPLLGYVLAWCVSVYFGRCYEDCLALSIETGVQNTGIAIFMLRFSLGQPEADLTTVVPVAVALMTPLPIMFLYLISKFGRRDKKCDQTKNATDATDTAAAVQTNYPAEDRVSAISLINDAPTD
ncbi:ileal sodium/bile acid cotransporter-like [Planococcus citri]|uniref:ileal sodium/bile acid cotransporter-like n=1 Tax=Planococcus citri TaxID=170843 RepID=UPI0031F9E6AA